MAQCVQTQENENKTLEKHQSAFTSSLGIRFRSKSEPLKQVNAIQIGNIVDRQIDHVSQQSSLLLALLHISLSSDLCTRR